MKSNQFHRVTYPHRRPCLLVILPALIAVSCCLSRAVEAPTESKTTARKLELNLDTAASVELPSGNKDLVPAAYNLPDQRQGWVVRLPDNRPIATPAYADGRIFIGGGYGSHEFYAFDAK